MISKKIKNGILKIIRILVDDKGYYKIRYFIKFKRVPDLRHPSTFNEKLHWLKLNDRNTFYSTLVDKYAVRNYVTERIGEKYLIDIIGIYRNAEEIDFEKLPERFVMKATHGSGWVIVCNNKQELIQREALQKMKYWLNTNFYEMWGEWPYKNVEPGIVCEKNIAPSSQGIPDYKFYCFNGIPRFVHVDMDRFEKHTRNFYDLNWQRLPFSLCYPNNETDAFKPKCLEEMIHLAEKLSIGLKFVRVDLYEVQGKVYFGELTFYPGNGLEMFSPSKYDSEIGKYLQL
jgi:hypothetical protein